MLVLVLSLIFICADDIITCKFDLGTFWRKSCFFCLHTLCNLSILILVISNYAKNLRRDKCKVVDPA